MKLTALALSTLMLATLGSAQAQERTFTMGAAPRTNGLIQTTRQTPSGPVIHFEQTARFGPAAQPQPLIMGLSAVDLTPDRNNLNSYPIIVPGQAFVGQHPWGQPLPGGHTPGFGWNQQFGPITPFYGGGVGVVLGDDEPHLYGW